MSDLRTSPRPDDAKMLPAYEPFERPGLVLRYVVGPYPIRKGCPVGLDSEGLLVPIMRAVCFVGMANDAHPGCPDHRPTQVVNVTVDGTFVFGFKGWKPSLHDLQRKVWAFDDTTVGAAPFRSDLEIGRVVGVETTSDGRLGVRVCINEAAATCLPPLPGKVVPREGA